MAWYKMFGFVKLIFVSAITFFGYTVLKVNSLECVSLNNQECKMRQQIMNINSNELSFYPCSIKIKTFRSSSNNINDPYAKMYVADVVRNINVKVFNLISWTNETRHIEWQQTWKCKCRLDAKYGCLI